jgi:hypothetical protein
MEEPRTHPAVDLGRAHGVAHARDVLDALVGRVVPPAVEAAPVRGRQVILTTPCIVCMENH